VVTRKNILAAGKQIAREFKPRRIILFGSYAYGEPTENSDVDLLVVMPFKGKDFRQAVKISSRLPRQLPVDVIVRTPQMLQRRIEMGDFFLREIVEKGEVLYEAADGGMD
jgi:predicted nucleotidyltransferase